MNRFIVWIRETAKALIANVIVAALVGGVVSYAISYRAQVDADRVAQSRETLIARANEFSTNSEAIVPLLGAYIRAVNSQTGLEEAKTALRVQLAEEIQRSESLDNVFGTSAHGAVEDYQKAIDLFQQSLANANDPTKMYEWSVYIDQVLQAKNALVKTLYLNADIVNKPA